MDVNISITRGESFALKVAVDSIQKLPADKFKMSPRNWMNLSKSIKKIVDLNIETEATRKSLALKLEEELKGVDPKEDGAEEKKRRIHESYNDQFLNYQNEEVKLRVSKIMMNEIHGDIPPAQNLTLFFNYLVLEAGDEKSDVYEHPEEEADKEAAEA
jgi:hypothetical protein